MARVVSWYERTDASAVMACEQCAWSGHGAALVETPIGDLLERACPTCAAPLEFACFPTDADIVDAAARGVPEAVEALEMVAWRARRHALPVALVPEDLGPLLPDAPDVIDIDHDTADELAPMLVVRAGPQELWREPASWNDLPGARRLLGLVWARYGDHIAGIRVSVEAKRWFVGDDLDAGRHLDLAIARPAP